MSQVTADAQFQSLRDAIRTAASRSKVGLLLLLAASAYAVAAAWLWRSRGDNVANFVHAVGAFFGVRPNDIALPFVEIEVSADAFFLLAPVVVLAVYGYLHMYVRELRSRLVAFYRFLPESTSLRVRSQDMLDPCLWAYHGVPDRRSRRSSRQGAAQRERRGGKDRRGKAILPFARLVSGAAVWATGPTAIFLLWVRYIGMSDDAFIVSGLCFGVSLWLAFVSYDLGLDDKPGRTGAQVVAFVFISLGTVVLLSVWGSDVGALFGSPGALRPGSPGYNEVAAFKEALDPWYARLLCLVIVVSSGPGFLYTSSRLFRTKGLKFRLGVRSWWVSRISHSLWRLLFIPSDRVLSDRCWRTVGLRAKVTGANLSGSQFVHLRLTGVSFVGCNLSGASFEGSDIEGMVLGEGTVFDESSFTLAYGTPIVR